MSFPWPRQVRAKLGPLLTGSTAIVLGTVAFSNLIRIFSSVTLTRLLDAEAYGVVGIIASMMFVVQMISDIGVLPFVVRHKDGDDPRFLDQVWTTRLIRSVILAGGMALLSGPLAAYAGKPELQLAIMAWGLNFLIDGCTSMAFATALREQRLKRLSSLDLSIGVLQVVLSIAATAMLRSYWGIVWASLASGVIKAFLSYWLFPNSGRRLAFDRARTAELWRFSRYIVSSSILGMLIAQTDKLFFARVMSLESFGLYTIATTLATAPMAIVNPFSERILFPAYSKAAREMPDRLREIYYARKRTVTLAFVFAMGGFIGSAPLIVEILYDPRYRAVTPLMQLLALAPAFAINNWAADRMLLAAGHAWSTVASNVIRIFWLGVGGLLAYEQGSQLLLVAVVGTMEVGATLFHWGVLRYYRLLDFKEELLPLMLGGIGFAIGTAGSSFILKLALG